ncbi:PP2C family protein-serine/threonine phosphatase [Streptomyces camelliae]|uniref:PP2C family protein-serine/threonine phosphatase n=1 Tax=Streptomyces camelliae TaxID=3004093 RepID=A0ABY7NV75_9ACTN|nr:PP2C family protein-serine/threonine phosphatase [Streptomyces sp. HUAS 2-6]WBO61694.1 PP2C family protein-serine/threonine phosphatase [Streptomyces sp. HUAS 2-6]
MASSLEECGVTRGAGARGRLLTVLPALLLLIGLFVGLFTPSAVRPDAFLATAMVSAAALLPLWGTVLIGVGGCAIFVGLMVDFHGLRDPTAYSELASLVAIAVFAVFFNRLLGRRAHQLVQVRSVAETAQLAVLHPVPRHLGHVTLESLYLAAAAEARIGGDLYEAIHTPHGVRLLIGDVRGKGLLAIQTAALLLSAFREAAHDAPDLPHLACRLETSMRRHASQYPGVPGSEIAERFITALLAEIPDDEPVVRTVTCGHPPPLLLHRGEVRELQPTAPSPPLNLGMLASDGYHVDLTPFQAGDQLLLYTDGVTETRDRSGAFYPLAERMRSWNGEAPHQLLDHLHRDLIVYSSGELDDDIAVLVAQRRPSHRA